MTLPQLWLPSGATALRQSLHVAARAPIVAAAAAPGAVGHGPPQRIPVAEPPRRTPVPLPFLNHGAQHAAASKVRPPAGVRVAGFPMLRPSEIDGVLVGTRARGRQALLHRSGAIEHASAPPTAAQRIVAPGRVRGATAPAPGAARTKHSVQLGSGTGINPWWRYQEEGIPGGGRVMVNVGTGNVLLQDDDMAVPHKGIAIAFRRTYNSQSGHDGAGSDGTPPGMYGNGWTNTFDAHLSGSSSGTMSVWDIDGARYDYTLAADGVTRIPPPGQHATLVSDRGCGYLWTKKSGTSYYFWTPDGGAPCAGWWWGTYGAQAGRLYQIIGRNRNIFLTFYYTWDGGNASPTGKIGAITAQAESGLSTTLSFADIGGHRLLDHITFPDGATTVAYGYDAQGNLNNVSRPPNNAGGARPSHSYGYVNQGAGGSIIGWADSPRWAASGSDGGVTSFAFSGSSPATATLSMMSRYANVNPVIADGTNSALQTGHSTAAYEYYDEFYTTGVPTPTFRDSDGHAMNWIVDSQGRPTQTQECTATTSGSCTGTWLVSNETWDSDNNLAVEVDARGNETDYLYDLMGNTTAVGEPYTTTSQGSFKPTRLYDYDEFNNVTAYCDPIETHAMNGDWTPSTTSIWDRDSLCAQHANVVPHWHATYLPVTQEPYGELISMTMPLGYTRTFSYDAGKQGGVNYGLPTGVTGDTIAQLDGSSITPAQTFWYDGTGNLRCYSKGVGTYVLSYDGLGRLLSEADPDDSSANAGSVCGKSTGQPGWNTQTTTTYFTDGSKASTQTPSERAFGVSASYTYDLDGNVITETQHHGCVPNQSCPTGTTRKWYDGADRLVEVAQPHDTRTFTSPVANYDGDPWVMRYLYDLSYGGTVTVTGSPTFRAYGNLFNTQTLLSDTAWTDVRGSAFDAADRETSKFSYTVSQGIGSHQLKTTTQQYGLDSTSLGLLAKKTNPSNESGTYSYDTHGRVASETYAGDAGRTAAQVYVYDPDGRKTAITSNQFGTQQYSYDTDGRLTTSIEPSGDGVTSPAQITYGYYANGSRSAVSVASSGLTQSNALTYSYRGDGLLRTQTVNAFSSGTWSRQYTDAGRLTSVSGADTQARSYDGSGQLANYTISAGTATYTHDPEGSTLTEYLPNVLLPGAGIATPETITSTLNVRGELVDSGISAGGASHRRMTTNSGCTATSTIPAQLSDYDPSQDWTTDPGRCDRVNGMSLAPDTSIQAISYNGQIYQTGTKNSVAFDATGRLASKVHTAYEFNTTGGAAGDLQTPAPDPGPAESSGGRASSGALWKTTQTTSVLTYDVENHLRTSQTTVNTTGTYVGGPPSATSIIGPAVSIGWAPNGHPMVVPMSAGTAPTSYMTAHWDGDITPRDVAFTGLSVYDRDPAGTIVETSNATGTTGFSPVDPSTVAGAGAGGTPNYRGSVVQMQYVRSDGFLIAGVQINGVRAYDPQLGAWTTPDGYEGEVHDPGSQQRYMWNRGNAFDYSDPSGYESQRGWYDTRTGLPILNNAKQEVIGQINDFILDIIFIVVTFGEGAAMRGGAVLAPRGGIGPVRAGQAGVLRSAAQATARGETTIGREVTVDAANRVRVRVDLVVRDAKGNIKFIESKVGSGRLSTNQRSGYPSITQCGGVVCGKAARAAGIDGTIGPTPVQVDHW